jgi:hypothetical protein
MTRFGTFSTCVGLVAAMTAFVSAQPAKPAQPVGQKPTLIPRKPQSLRVQSRPATDRMLSKSAINQLVLQPLTPMKTQKPAGAPSKQALVVVLENGGVMSNVDPALRKALNVNIKTASCGDWEFELSAGESIQDLVGRAAGQLAGNLECLNPAKWKQTAFNPLTWLNDVTDAALENAVKANNSLLQTQSRYDRVVVMEDSDAVPARVIAAIRQLEPTHVIDVHVLTHGGREFFVGHNGSAFTQLSFFDPLKADKVAGKLFLRAVYQMNCISGTLKDNWVALGAVVVNGTREQHLNNMPHQYFHFLDRWLNQLESETTASQRSFDDAAIYTRPVYSLIGKGEKVDTSRLTTTGSNTGTNVNTAR